MRKSCVKPVEILFMGRGNEQILCTFSTTTKPLIRVKTAVYTHLNLKLTPIFPQAKRQILTLLQSLFSPQSTIPINTITIHIN